MSQLLDQVLSQYKEKLPFVCFRNPNGEHLQAYLCSSDELLYSKEYTEQGFLFAPFDDRKEAIIFPIGASQILKEEIQIYKTEIAQTEYGVLPSSSEEHENLVRSGVEAIKKEKFGKVVLSRKETIEFDEFNFVEVFKRLLNSYTNAFAYVWYHPKVGLWMGATPERLVSLENSSA